MARKDNRLLKENMGEILDYQVVLSNMLKRKVSIEQAYADWIEKGYSNKYKRRQSII